MRRAVIVLAALAACDRHTAAPPAPATSASVAAAPAASAAPLAGGTPCGVDDLREPVPRDPRGALSCTQFDSPRDAMRAALAGNARIVALGEAHAPKGATAPSAAKRFTDDLLPLLAGRASDLLVELMMPPKGCADAAAEVRQKQAPATSQQAPTNQNEYLAMGDKARALGIVPDMLRPSCVDMDGVRDAGDGAIEASLEMIARLSTAQAEKLLDRDARSEADRGKAVVVYGGMLHNDLDPPPERAKWSYATALDAKTGGQLVAIDLVVPEFIVDDATWRGFAWFSHYDRARLGAKTTLFRLGEKSFVLVFPETRQ
ncbi:MAG TPA: hypothetical protein VGL81_31285 [Polyangiaceae bacterium]